MRQAWLAATVVAAAAGCGRAVMDPATAPGTLPDARGADSVIVNGPLRLTLRDFPVQAGVFWALPSVVGRAGGVTVESTRYGSLCRLDVTGRAAVDGAQVTLEVRFAERLASCTAEIRALRYQADVALPAGTYDVSVVHRYEDTRADTLTRRAVVVF